MAKSMIRSLKTEASCIERTPKLLKGLKTLKEMHLLQGKELQKVTYEGKRCVTIMNDYHTRKSNSGYARGILGRHYTR